MHTLLFLCSVRNYDKIVKLIANPGWEERGTKTLGVEIAKAVLQENMGKVDQYVTGDFPAKYLCKSV